MNILRKSINKFLFYKIKSKKFLKQNVYTFWVRFGPLNQKWKGESRQILSLSKITFYTTCDILKSFTSKFTYYSKKCAQNLRKMYAKTYGPIYGNPNGFGNAQTKKFLIRKKNQNSSS